VRRGGGSKESLCKALNGVVRGGTCKRNVLYRATAPGPSARPAARRLPARVPPAAEALFEVRREAAGRHLAAALHAGDQVHRRRRVGLAKHIGRPPRARHGVERPRGRRRRGRRLGCEPQLGLSVGFDRDLGARGEEGSGRAAWWLGVASSSASRARAAQRARCDGSSAAHVEEGFVEELRVGRGRLGRPCAARGKGPAATTGAANMRALLVAHGLRDLPLCNTEGGIVLSSLPGIASPSARAAARLAAAARSVGLGLRTCCTYACDSRAPAVCLRGLLGACDGRPPPHRGRERAAAATGVAMDGSKTAAAPAGRQAGTLERAGRVDGRRSGF
jgi:hypothetical protein